VIAFYQITSPSLAPEDVALPPITTPTYAIEFQKAIEASSRGRQVLTVQVGNSLGQRPTLAGHTHCFFVCYVSHVELLCLYVNRAFGK
jgi:hypothetical protein